MPANPTHTLAAFVTELQFDRLSDSAAQRVKEITLDTLASAIAGRRGDETAQIEAFATAICGPGPATILGGTATLSPAGATLVNGYQVTAVTVCDIFRPALCHISPQVIPPAMALAQQRPVDGRTFLTAVAAGLEATTRVGYALNYDAFRARGWHAPGVIGPFGGAAAAGYLLGLDVERQRNAFALAGSQSAGTFAHWGTPTIKFHQSRGALSGLMAASLAAEGFRSAEDILGNPDGGLLATYTDGGNPDAIGAGLGERWTLEDIALRRWPAGSLLQTMITSLLALAEEHDLDATDIAEVRVALSETIHDMHGDLPWQDRFRAQLSGPYLAGVVLHDRRCWLDQFEPARFTDASLDRFIRERVKLRADPDLDGTAVKVEIEMADGTVHRDARDTPKGDPSDPLTLDEIVGKFRDAGEGLLSPAVVDKALDQLLDLENVDDVAPLIAMLSAA